MAQEPRFLTLTDVAEILNVSWSQAYALVRRKELIAIQIGGRGQWRVERARLEEYIQQKYAETAAWVRDNPLAEREADISAFYADPAGNESVLQKYDVDYILLGDYERYELHASQATLDALYPLVFESSDGRIRIYQVTESHG